MDFFMEDAEKILTEIARTWELDIIWKRIGSGRIACELSAAHTWHCCEFCQKVKNNPRYLKQCSYNDTTLLTALAKEKKKPFIHRCHAGVCEYVLPVFYDGDELEVILLGVFRQEEQHTASYPELQEDFEKLPFRDENDFRTAEPLLTPLMKVLRERREYLKIKALASEIKDPRIQETILYLEKNFARKISIPHLAGLSFLSISRFQHIFKTETGMSLFDYLNRLRLENAAEMLRTTELPLNVISERCGISDQSRLGVLFKKQYNCTPLAYRKQFRNI
jgi:AraC-like DNA-binding protein